MQIAHIAVLSYTRNTAHIMNTIDIACVAGERKTKLLPLLRGNIFHVTSFEALGAIIEEGIIKNNRAGKLKYSYPQSKISYGNKKGFICLFDFRNIKASDIYWSNRKYPIFSRDGFLLLQDKYWIDIIRPQDRHLSIKEMYIPESEVWYPRDIKTTIIETCIRVMSPAV